MGCGSCFMITLRLFQLVCAAMIIGIGAWVAHTADSARQKGDKFLDEIFHGSPKEAIWKHFFDSLIKVPMRVWFALGAGSWVVLAIIFLLLATKLRWRVATRGLLITLEFITMLIMMAAFAAVASLAIELEPICIVLDVAAPELMAFFRVCPVSKAYAVSGGLSWFLFILTATAVLVQNCCSRDRKKKLSFEPEAGGQAPGHGQAYGYGYGPGQGYQSVPLVAVQPPGMMYDPYMPKSAGWKGEEVGVMVREVRRSMSGDSRGSREKALPLPPRGTRGV